MHQGLEQPMPSFNLPSKILCRVINVHCRAEPETDEVLVQITLMAELDQSDVTSPDPLLPEAEESMVHSFCRTLTTSDISIYGGLSIRIKDAYECLPPLDMSQQPPSQELVTTDLYGNKWHFRHILRGDTIIFLRGENGELRVGIRRHMRRETNTPSLGISTHNMNPDELATASQAIASGLWNDVFNLLQAKVQLDEPSSISCPTRVSPWDLEPF